MSVEASEFAAAATEITMISDLISLVFMIVSYIAMWFIFKKMGRKAWEGIIPLYNYFILFKILYSSGWKMLMLLIPFYNIYLLFKFNIDLAKKFGKSAGFGVGLVFLEPIFKCILAFGNAEFTPPESEPEIEYEF